MLDPADVPPISPDVAAELGYITVQWSVIERQISQLIAMVTGMSTLTGDAVTAELSSVQKMNLLTVLIELTRKKVWIDDWAARYSRIDAARIRRNELIHSMWTWYQDNHTISKISAKGSLKRTVKPVKLKELSEFRRSLAWMSEGLSKFHKMATMEGFIGYLDDSVLTQTQNPMPNGQVPTRNPSQAHRSMQDARDRKRSERAARGHHLTKASGGDHPPPDSDKSG